MARSRDTLMSSFTHDPEALGANVLSVALIGPQEPWRRTVAAALSGSQATVAREIPSYPDLDDVPRILEAEYDVVIIELDSDPEHALDLVEHICSNSSATVMVYSAHSEPELLVRCMRSGAREFLSHPIAASTIAEAMVRASVRRPAARAARKASGKLLVFIGAKGGSGATTVAANFAVALAQESGRTAALVDLNLPLGNAAIELGLTAQLSVADALQNLNRLDSNFLSTLLVRHNSGLAVLAAPDRHHPARMTEEAAERLAGVVRQDFDYVVVDAGSGVGPAARALLDPAACVYLVTQVSIAELRNSNRIVSEFFSSGRPQLEIVLNRYSPKALGIEEEAVTKALTTPAKWRVPSDYDAARQAQNTATPLVLQDSPIARVIRQMARTACGLPPTADKKKKFSLFG